MTMSRDFTTINGRQIRHDVATKNYVCGECESPLVTVFDREWMTVCAKNRKHTYFITKYSLAQRISNEMQQAENLTIADRRLGMGLKDRDDEYGQPTRMRLGRVGRIRQGVMVPNKKGEGEHPEAVDYFIIDPSTDIAEERAQILSDVRAAIDKRCPGQNLEKPTVIPIMFLADRDEMIAPESYKVRKGKSGTIWCAGDGEFIQWKLNNDFRIEVSNGTDEAGKQVTCPGKSQKNRHAWCSECTPELELNFAIMGYERTGTWMIRTKSMIFRDQFWTQVGLVRSMAVAGIIPGLIGVPFLLRRQKEMVTAPIGDDPKMTPVEMPLDTIEVHPEWLRNMMKGSRVLTNGFNPVALPATATPEQKWDGVDDQPDLEDVFDGEYDEPEVIPEFPHDPSGFFSKVNEYTLARDKKMRYGSVKELSAKLKDLGVTMQSWPQRSDDKTWNDLWRMAVAEELPF